MSKLITGIVAHVDAGKTTLSEALLYSCGTIRKLGRVDDRNSFLDTDSIERRRGITIFSKEAVLNDDITLIDTPGHVDFTAEMERALAVLDAAILLVSASDGIQAHTKTLWSLLKKLEIPTLIFVNKTDTPGTDKNAILNALKNTFSKNTVDFENTCSDSFYEQIAETDDSVMEKYLCGEVADSYEIAALVSERKIFPVLFGSALKLENIDRLINVLSTFFSPKPTGDEFGCFVYKISADRQGNRLSHLKITGGTLHAKALLGSEKANEIRIYSGDKYETVQSVDAGSVCVVTGLYQSKAGSSYGNSTIRSGSIHEPALVYSVSSTDKTDPAVLLKVLKCLEDEMPELNVRFQTEQREIQVMLMGEIQTEVITELVHNRFNIDIAFGEGKIAYKETICNSTIGVGHYEPLKHYAEVQLRLSPLPRGSGLVFSSDIPVNDLELNWQRLILTHLAEKQHLGVLTGSPITDIRIEVIAGRAHLKHTEGGDFRQATYRGVRNGLMKADSILLEPFYSFETVVPDANTGRVLSDVEKMHGSCTISESKAGFTTLTGRCPVATMRNYISDVRAFSKGQGTLNVVPDGYDVCHNSNDVIDSIGYEAEADKENPASSVFCAHGAGFTVPWQEVDNYKHIKKI